MKAGLKLEDVLMKSEYPFLPAKAEKENKLNAPSSTPTSSRFLDEKISDESGTETLADSAMKPTGLKNPFWN